MRPLAAIALLLCATATATGCSSSISGDRGDARKGGSVLVGLGVAPDSLDPALARSPEALQALWLAYTPPLTFARAQGAQGTKVVPGLAEAQPEADQGNTVFEFRLRRDLVYSDGRAVLAADVERAIRRSRALNPQARRELDGIQTVEADEKDRSVRITLSSPDPEFPQLLTTLWTAPVPPGTPTRDLSRTPVTGVGPYRLEPPTRGRAYVLTRQRGFRLAGVPEGNVDSVAGSVVRAIGRRTSLTLSGRLDVTQGEPPVARLPQIRSEFKARYREFATLTERHVAFDLDRPPFNDRDMRQAVAYALDLRALARLEDGFLAPSCNVIPSQVPGYLRLDPCPYGTREGDSDLVRAERLARRSPERATRVLVDGGDGEHAAALARYGVETLDKIGVRARRATTPRERARAQLRFAQTAPERPEPAPYLAAVPEPRVRTDVAELLLDDKTRKGPLWADLDRDVVERALIAPFGIRTTGVLLSERLATDRCLRFHPVYGVDFSSLCLG